MRYLFILLFAFALACGDNDDNYDGPCDAETAVDEDKYNSTEIANYTLTEVRLMEDCLEITLAASGCDGNTWMLDLIDAGSIAESFPVQRFMRVKLDNNESCLAVIQKTLSFDLTPIRTDEEIIRINLDGWQDQIEYSY